MQSESFGGFSIEIDWDYLAHNATRNRALGLLPLLAEIDEYRVAPARLSFTGR